MSNRFLHWLLVVVIVLSMAACAPAAEQPTATPAPTVAPTITSDAAQPLVLVLPGGSEQKTMIAVNRHYSDVVKHKGWNVDLYTVRQITNNAGEDIYLQYVAKQLSAGATRADGYFGWFGCGGENENLLKEVKAQGLLYDCSAAASRNVPNYWARFRDQISQSPYGLPLCQAYEVPRRGPMLALRSDVCGLAPQGPMDYTGVRSLLDDLKQLDVPNRYLEARFDQWMDLWASQQGYMELFSSTGVYARLDDPDARPVFLENIPSAASFLKDARALREGGLLKLIYLLPDPESDQPAAMLDRSDSSIAPHVERNYTDYVAYPIQNDQPYSSDISYGHSNLNQAPYLLELIIPAKSRRAADAMAFVQWVYDSQDNAECVIYGQQGEDFTLRGERISLSPELVKKWSTLSEDYWPGRRVFGGAAQVRIRADTPENAKDMRTAWAQQRLAAPWLSHLYDSDLQDALYGMYPGDKRQEQIAELTSLMQSELPGQVINMDDWLMALRQATPENYLEPYLDALRQAKAREP